MQTTYLATNLRREHGMHRGQRLGPLHCLGVLLRLLLWRLGALWQLRFLLRRLSVLGLCMGDLGVLLQSR